jgi:DtxR family Mn-dependent transcriptional regulator
MACRTIRKRRLLETFLFTMAGYGIHELHEDACRLEHLISDRFADALDRMLGYPVHDPHGHPIPSSDGTLRKESLEPLSAVAEGQTVRIAQLRSADPEVLEYAARLGLLPGKSCTVIQKAPFQGPLTIADGSERIAIAFELASVIDIQASTEESPDVSDSSRQSISSFVRQSAGH